MKSFLLRSAAAAALTASLAACDSGGGGGGGGGTPPTPPAPPAPARIEDGFGPQFGAAFRADANSNPRDPAAGDLVPVSFTTDPVNIP